MDKPSKPLIIKSLVSLVERSYIESRKCINSGNIDKFIDTVLQMRETLKHHPLHSSDIADVWQYFSQTEIIEHCTWINTYFERMIEFQHLLEHLNVSPQNRDWLNESSIIFRTTKLDIDVLCRFKYDMSDQLVFVGSGSFPQSLLYMYKNTQIAKLIGLDVDPDALFFSTKLVNHFAVDDRINVLLRNGADYNYSQADVVLLASLVRDKSQVLHQFISTGKPGSICLIRIPVGLGHLIYEDVDLPQSSSFTLVDQIKTPKSLFGTKIIQLNKQSS